jgi:hypothetical protein
MHFVQLKPDATTGVLGSARALACSFRRPRRKILFVTRTKGGPEKKFAMARRAIGPSWTGVCTRGVCAPQKAAVYAVS